MHNLKDLRKNIEIFKKKFKDRNIDLIQMNLIKQIKIIGN